MQSVPRVGIFWDFENCTAPTTVRGDSLASNIRECLQEFGPITTFKAYLDLSHHSAQSSNSSRQRSELQLSGVSLTDTPHNGRKDVADQMIIVDMLLFALDGSPSSTTVVLITGDRDFAYAVAVLRLRMYQVVLISPSTPHPSLVVHASVAKDWNADVLKTLLLSDPAAVALPQTPPLRRPVTSQDARRPISFSMTTTAGVAQKFSPRALSGTGSPFSFGAFPSALPTSPGHSSSDSRTDLACTPSIPTVSARASIRSTSPPSSQSDNQERFGPLIRILKTEGKSKQLRSRVASELMRISPTIYDKDTVPGFAKYSRMAEEEGVVELGGDGGSAWITLRPELAT